MLRHPEYTRNRIRQLVDRVQQLIYPQKQAVDQILVSPRTDRIDYAQAMKLKYRPAKLGQQFGPLWATFWFKLAATVPTAWAGKRVDLLWVSHSEATLWLEGRAIQGLNWEPNTWSKGVRPDAVLTTKAKAGQKLHMDIEMACNQVFGEGSNHKLTHLSPYILDQCDLALFDKDAWELYHDLKILVDLEGEQDRGVKDIDKSWTGHLLGQLNTIANLLDLDDRATWPKVRPIIKALYGCRNATQVHEISALGHAHIDTAWLWPLGETYRKCVRTFSTQTLYMDEYPEYKFACSQAQQYAWIKERNPDLYARIKAKVKAGQWIPVGGTWIEPDCNIPSGEALARQFLLGQRFFQQEFGITCNEFWNPDVFGYNGQLPQLIRQSGMTRFLTQKLSWNRFTKPLYHTFTWQGIDGSEVFTHFPPADTYNALTGCDNRPHEVDWFRHNARNFKDHDRSHHSLMLFGFGDGGGGPTKQMLEVLSRVHDLQGLPRVNQRTSDEFFDLLEKDCIDRPTVVGELYFEYHRGTYTTQAATKKGNRKGEWLLHDVEFLSSLAARLGKQAYPAAELEALWKILLLNQFHDILPGSSITLVYDDAAKHYAELQERGGQLRKQAITALGSTSAGAKKACTPVNTLGFSRREVVSNPEGTLVFVEAPSYGFGAVTETPDRVSCTDGKARGNFVLENSQIRAELTRTGRLVSLLEKRTGRESLSGPGNVLKFYDDQPTACDAWDVDPFHLETAQDLPGATSAKIVTALPLRGEIEFTGKIGKQSGYRQVVRLDAESPRLEFSMSVDWHESHKMLKVAFPVAVRAMNATYEMPFGFAERPTHFNTAQDIARYEVPGHKWADLSEHGFGVALLTESKYGYSTFDHTMQISLLRASKHPDPQADQGHHEFAYAILPHAGGWREAGVVAEATRFNVPVLWAQGQASPRSFAVVEDANLVLDTIKKAEDSDSLVLRFYEAHGARGVAKVRVDLPFKSATYCNILEEDGAAASVRDGIIEIPYTPSQIISLKLSPAGR